MNTFARRLIVLIGFGSGLLCLGVFGVSFLSLRNFIFFLILSFLSISDLREYRVPNISIVLCIMDWAAGLFFVPQSSDILKNELIAAFVFGFGIYFFSVFFRVLFRKKVLGGGDIKMFFVTGLFLGTEKMLYMLFAACAVGLVSSFIFGRKRKIPFVPSISFATVIMMMPAALTNIFF